MNADEIRIAVAKEMGKCTHGPDKWAHEGTDGDMELVCTTCRKSLRDCRPDDYTSDHNAAMTLVERLQEEGWSCSVMRSCKKDTWSVRFDSEMGEQWSVAETLPLAICEAFLKVRQAGREGK